MKLLTRGVGLSPQSLLGCASRTSERLCTRRAFTVFETVIAAMLMVSVMLWLSYITTWSLGERTRLTARQDALEAAANVLETARACPWNDLTPDWAAKQRLPEYLAQPLSGAQLKVRVEPDAARPQIKRVTVAVHWPNEKKISVRPVELVGLFSDSSSREMRNRR